MARLVKCSRGHEFDKTKFPTCPFCWPGKYLTNKKNVIDEYIACFPPGVQKLLKKVRETIRDAVPDATETISYAIPTFDLNGKHLVHFAGFKHHIGFYPTSSGIAAFKKEITGYKNSRGSVQFPIDKPIPFYLIRKIVAFRINEIKK